MIRVDVVNRMDVGYDEAPCCVGVARFEEASSTRYGRTIMFANPEDAAVARVRPHGAIEVTTCTRRMARSTLSWTPTCITGMPLRTTGWKERSSTPRGGSSA